MKKPVLILFFIILIFTGCSNLRKADVLVILQSTSEQGIFASRYLVPYLDHFGIPYKVVDLSKDKIPENYNDYSLVILAHDLASKTQIEDEIRKYYNHGAGIVSFDPDLFLADISNHDSSSQATSITFDPGHYITALHAATDTLKLSKKIEANLIERFPGKPIVMMSSIPLVIPDEKEGKRIVYWTSMDWMSTEVLGPLMGLDDCLWRSLVWAAKKPFVMEGLPPLVTMRVDDVAGRGELWGQSPLYWVKTANQYGFKPWLGLFIYNLDPAAITELRNYLLSGNATAAPHALGRPNRTKVKNLDIRSYLPGQPINIYDGMYYNSSSLPLRVKSYDEFIYFDHDNKKPWSDTEANRGLDAADKWYAENKPFPMSKYLVPHFYELAGNVTEHVSDKWGIEYIAMNREIDKPYADSNPWIMGAPFRLFETPGTCTNNPALRGDRAVYYADFVEINNKIFFNCFTEIRDDAGYEWAPDNNVRETAKRGIRQLRRALNSMALPVLFTHDTDFIYRISPENWNEELKLIRAGIDTYNPILLTMDDALRIVRAQYTSRLNSVNINSLDNTVSLNFTGTADTVHYVYVFTDSLNGINQHLIPLERFDQNASNKIKLTFFK